MASTCLGFSPVRVWDLPLAPFTMADTLAAIESLIEAKEPAYLITANLNYAMLTERDARLEPVNEGAAFIVADGMPLLWGARLAGCPLPERVTGSDLLPNLCRLSAEKGVRLFFLGGAPGVAESAKAKLEERFPDVRIVGSYCPPFRELTDKEMDELESRIRQAAPDVLIGAFSQPRGEIWIAEHHRRLGAPVSMQIGASFDFAAGMARRAPRSLQRLGLEWLYRTWREPRRMAPRYWRNGTFLLRRLLGSLFAKPERLDD